MVELARATAYLLVEFADQFDLLPSQEGRSDMEEADTGKG
jgi:hypothetical protein